MKKKITLSLIPALLCLLLSACSDSDDPQPQFTIQLAPTALTLTEGESGNVAVSGAPDGATITWASENANIAKVSDGKVEAVVAGTTNIVATAQVNGETARAKCAVTVKTAPGKLIVKFADANLKKQLLALKPSIDVNNDDEISVSEAQAVTSIDIHFETKEDAEGAKVIRSLGGLEYFTNLRSLNLKNQSVTDASPVFKLAKLEQLVLGGNNIKTLDLSAMTALKDLRLYDNAGLTTLDLSKNTQLEELYIQRTGISSLDISMLKKLTLLLANGARLTSLKANDLPELDRIDAVKNQLTTLEVTNLPKLTQLHADNNKLTSVKLENLPMLNRLNLYANKLETINLDLPRLLFLFLHENPLKSLDMSKLPMLLQISVSNTNLTTLDFSHNPIIRNVEATYMPKLEEINLRNGAEFNDESEYLIIEGNTALKRIRVDAGDEEKLVKTLVGSKNISVVAE